MFCSLHRCICLKIRLSLEFNDYTLIVNNVCVQMMEDLLSEKYANDVRLRIKDDETFNDPEHYGAKFYNQEDHGTAHISVLDENGDAVSVTSTINL